MQLSLTSLTQYTAQLNRSTVGWSVLRYGASLYLGYQITAKVIDRIAHQYPFAKRYETSLRIFGSVTVMAMTYVNFSITFMALCIAYAIATLIPDPYQQFGKFSVIEINPKDWPSVIKTAEVWKGIAQEKYRQACNGKYPRTRSEASSDPGAIFLTSCEMVTSITACLSDTSNIKDSEREPWDSVLVCIDESGKQQAIALFEKNGLRLKLAYLAAHPDNIPHKINDNTTNKRGAGSAIILYLAQLALRANMPVYTRATNDAVGFYKKCGFTEAPEIAQSKDGFHEITPMKLTEGNIRHYISEKIQPFHLLASVN